MSNQLTKPIKEGDLMRYIIVWGSRDSPTAEFNCYFCNSSGVVDFTSIVPLLQKKVNQEAFLNQ